MSDRTKTCELTVEDLRAALKELHEFVDVTEEDLKTIFDLAQKHAQERKNPKFAVKRTMTMEVVTVKKEADIRAAADLLTKHRISGMPVVDDEDRVVGVISEADILAVTGIKRDHGFKDILRHLLGEPVPKVVKDGHQVSDLMSSPPITTGPDSDIREVAAILDEKRIKRLPVVNDEGKLLGVISRADIIRILGHDAMPRNPKSSARKTA
ncbi:MAG: CBS domain-containing protein [Nitrospiraceae bacterium]|nr:CBS domain-containing protein [Nitrospiraceae bacterium]